MRPHRDHWLFLAAGLLAFGLSYGAVGAVAVHPVHDQAGPIWHALHFRIRKFFFTADAQIRWRLVPSEKAMADLIAAVEGSPRRPAGPTVGILELHIRHFLGHLTRTLWIDPDTGRPLQVREDSDEDTTRIWRYLEEGVLHLRKRYRDDGPPDVSRKWVPVRAGEREPMIEADSLLVLIPAARLREPGDHVRFVLRVKDRPVPVEARVEEIVRADSRCCGEDTRQGPADRELLRIRVQAADPQGTLHSVGLRGPLEVYLDRGTRAPVRVVGRLKWIGRVQASLVGKIL